LSSAWAEAIFDYALACDFTKPAETVTEIQASTANATYLNKAILGCLPRGRKLLPLPTESLQPQQFDIASFPDVQTLALGKRIPDHCSAFPKGSKLLCFANVSGGDDVDAKVGLPKAAVIGIPKEPSHFLAEACKLVHPTVMAMSVGGMLVQNILRVIFWQKLANLFTPLSWPCLWVGCWCRISFLITIPADSTLGGYNVCLQASLFLCVQSCVKLKTCADSKWLRGPCCSSGC